MSLPVEPLRLTISIVIYRQDYKVLAECIESVITAIRYLRNATPSVEETTIFVINNGATTDVNSGSMLQLQAQAREINSEITLIEGQGNIGYGAAHNLAIENLDGGLHVLINPDVALSSDCLYNGVRFFSENDTAVCLSPQCYNFSGEKQYLCKQYPSVFSLALRGISSATLNRIFQKKLDHYEMKCADFDKAFEARLVSGCFMMCKVDALKLVQGFEEKYFLYFEDFDLSLRLGAVGKLFYVPSMKIKHAGGGAAKKGFMHILIFMRSAIRFFSSHGWKYF